MREDEYEKICWKCGNTFSSELEVCPDDGARLLELNPDDRSDPLIGTLFDGRFRIYRKLGEGGMGTVYSARQIDFERDVALKILKVDFLRDENIRKRFMYEARTISNLRHPNAVRIFDFGQAPDGSVYMVMELLVGESLADRLAYKFLKYRDILEMVPPICGVLGEAHRNDVVHRDLKPENIFIGRLESQPEFYKLLDFGIAKHLRDETMTRSGTLWGTPAYMSPEQAKGGSVAAAADIYAIGIILYELISGNLPFHSTTQMGLAMKHISVPARSLLSIPGLSSVPAELDNLILSALAKDPADRPENMELFAEQLISIKSRLFDDALLDSVPAEEVDALELQRWIQEEPDVSEDASGEFRALTSGEHRALSEASAAPNVDLSDTLKRPTTPTNPVPPAPSSSVLETAEMSSDDLAQMPVQELLEKSGAARVVLAVFVAAIVVGVIGMIVMNPFESSSSPSASAAATTDERSGGNAARDDAASASASRAASVILSAQKVAVDSIPDERMIFVDGVEEVDRDGNVIPRARPATKRKKSDELKGVKDEIQGTF